LGRRSVIQPSINIHASTCQTHRSLLTHHLERDFPCIIDLVLKIIVSLIIVTTMALAAGMYVAAGRAPGPTIEVHQPAKYVGRSAVFDITVETPAGQLTSLDAAIEQNGATLPLFSLADPRGGTLAREGATRLRATRTVDRTTLPELRPGSARMVITAGRSVLFGLREQTATVDVPLEARFDPPRLAVVSLHHYINHGGSEAVVYRVTPPDADSGVRVGDRVYPGYRVADVSVGPSTSSGRARSTRSRRAEPFDSGHPEPFDTVRPEPVEGRSIAQDRLGRRMTFAQDRPAEARAGDDSTRVAFLALLHDQDVKSPVELWARDPAGNEARASFDHRIFPKEFRRARIDVTDALMERVVPEILDHSPEFKADLEKSAINMLLDRYLAINRDLRRRNNERLARLGAETAPTLLWDGPFLQLSNSQVESGFAEYRTYLYNGKEVDQQVHLGFDLAVTANVPVVAANRGRVVFADYLGIYGNAIVIDHGMGLQSLYAHLSSIDMRPGEVVDKSQVIGRSGMTGLAGGDHLHYTLLLHGQPVTPVEWWDPHWVEDRILRKLRDGSKLAP
jgi:murein DD-endopeptidase MepM/ murein hydrolase activator NlpD